MSVCFEWISGTRKENERNCRGECYRTQFVSADRRQLGRRWARNVWSRQFDSSNLEFRLKCPNRFLSFGDAKFNVRSNSIRCMIRRLYDCNTRLSTHTHTHGQMQPQCMTNQSSKLSDLPVHRIIFDNSHFVVTVDNLMERELVALVGSFNSQARQMRRQTTMAELMT